MSDRHLVKYHKVEWYVLSGLFKGVIFFLAAIFYCKKVFSGKLLPVHL